MSGQSAGSTCYDLAQKRLTRVRKGLTETSVILTYAQIGNFLGPSPLEPTAGEAHGMLCGLICGGDPEAEQRWFAQLFPDVPPGDLLQGDRRAALAPLVAQTRDELAADDGALTLLLPDDAEPLLERVTAVYDWVRGFLFAIGLQGISERDLSLQGREILDDFIALTRVDLDALEPGEENEQALMEVVELVRVAAMLFHAERATAQRSVRAR